MVGKEPPCYWCLMRVAHPWHDNGTPGPLWYLWSQGQAYGTPIAYTKETGYQ